MERVKSDYIPRYTYEDYVQWEGKWELINGIPYAMTPSPILNHQLISGNIYDQLLDVLKKCADCQALLPVDWKIDASTVVQPDNMVVCGKLSGPYLTKSPALIFEILSPTTGYKDRNIKYELYQKQKVKYYVVVDIDAKVAEVFELRNEKYEKICDAQTDVMEFDFGACRIKFDFADIWQIAKNK